jgi:hypothetical protein
MNSTGTLRFRLVPIDATVAAALRETGGIRYVADSKPGYPCRQCLRDAELGEEVLLVSYDPFTRDSPYRGAGPIFLHTQRCAPDPGASVIPDQLLVRQLSVRAFDAEAMMVDAALIDGSELQAAIEQFFADSDTDEIHVHNASRGCWAVTVARA